MESVSMSRNVNANGQVNGRWTPSAWQPANEDKLPPHNLEAELSLLGSILWDGARLEAVEKICKPEHFYRQTHEVVFRRMLHLHANGKAVDVVTLGEDLEKLGYFERVGGHDFFESCTSIVPHALNANYYAEIVRNNFLARMAIEELTGLLKRAYNQQELVEDVIDETIHRLEVIRELRDDDAPTPISVLPTRLAAAAYHGPVAEAAEMIEPDTEACIEAILVQLLVIFGNEFGPRPHWMANTKKHRCNEFVCLVGPTGEGRKNTSNDVSEWLLARVQERTEPKPRAGGLTSGEGLIQHVLDNHGEPVIYLEDEFDGTLSKMKREGNSLSSVLRQAWDRSNLEVLTRANPLKCYNAYVSLIAMTNYTSLENVISSGQLTTGFANRFLWINTYQARWLEEGGDFHAVVQRLELLLPQLRGAFEFAKRVEPNIPFLHTPEAKEYWRYLYHGPFAEHRVGAFGDATRRRGAHCRRLALIYAVLDQQNRIGLKHLEAAKAIVDYSDATAAVIFKGMKMDRDEVKILDAFKADRLESKEGWTRTQINRKVFGGHKPAEELDEALTSLHRAGALVAEDSTRNGKVARLWKVAKKG
jgi:hypothetical protein